MTRVDQVEAVARAICDADVLAPAADDPIYIGTRPAKAWEARIPLARAALSASKPLVVEECAKVADAEAEKWRVGTNGDCYWAADAIAKAIRALKESPSEARDGCGGRRPSELQSPKGGGG